MKKIIHRVFSFFNLVESKIAFYPSILSLFGILFSFFMLTLDQKGISKVLIENIPNSVMKDGSTTINLISVCVGGLISMMVFSFSMVMLLLSQASQNYSPRLLPGLISDKRHQVILGIYLSTIFYLISVLFSIDSEAERNELPNLSIIIGIVFTITCFAAFIYFIHNISQSIQISNISENIYRQSKSRISIVLKKEKELPEIGSEFEDTKSWYSYKIEETGYFQNISIGNVISHAKQYETKLHILIPKGIYIHSNMEFLRSEKKLDATQLKAIVKNISFAKEELIVDNYVLAFKQLTEIAIKAMSPGINDPGTALDAIEYLTDLLALRMQKKDTAVYFSEELAIIRVEIINFKALIENIMSSLRTYCSADPTLVKKLLWMLNYLEDFPNGKKGYKKIISKEKNILRKCIDDSLNI